MRTWFAVTLSMLLVTCALAQQPDIAVVKATFSIKERPAEGRGSIAFSKIVEATLAQSGLAYDMITEEEVVEGKLAGYKLAIFPYSAVWHDDEIQQVVEFVEGGGKLMCFYTVPAQLRPYLGIGKYGSRRAEYEGEFQVMQFVEDRPPGFPAQVHQDSPNTSIVEAGEGGRVIATWLNKDGEDGGVPAVLLSDHGVYVSHVFKSGTTSEQHMLVLATVGHFMPEKWTEMVEGAIEQVAAGAGYESLEAMLAATATKPVADKQAKAAQGQVTKARELLAAKKYAEALDLAKQAQSSAQMAAAAAFPSRPYELRGAWMGFPSDDTNWEQIFSEMEDANFNAIFPLMCSGGAAAYPSDYLPQITQTDQLKACIEAAHRHGIEVHPWRINWYTSRAPAEHKQQLIDDGRMILSVDQAMGKEETSQTHRWSTNWLNPSDERNRELEFNAMTEMVEKYDVDGIHFDYMRYPSKYYSYADVDRERFEEWAGVKVESWPEDCWEGGKYLAKYRDWRRHLQTSLVKRIAERAREIDPNVKISLAARASVTGAPENDAQDWMTWAHEGYLDFLCPMDYTSSVQTLIGRLAPQIEVIDGAIPVYAGLGVSPTRSATPVNLSQQIEAARKLGADGFLMFSLTPFSRAMLPALKLGATSTPVTIMPHHVQPATVTFRYPDGIEGAPERTYAPNTPLSVGIHLAAEDENARELLPLAYVMPAAGGEAKAVVDKIGSTRTTQSVRLEFQPKPGIYQIVLKGDVILADGRREPFYLRSRPLNVLTQEQTDELLGRLNPPDFETDKLHVGVIAGGYGSEGILQALQGADKVEAKPVHQFGAEFLTPCQVLIFPQLRGNTDELTDEVVQRLRAFVEAGGGLLVTHDAVGMRSHPATFPEVAKGLDRPIKEAKLIVAVEHALSAGMKVGDTFAHTYYDHIPLAVGENAAVVIKDAEGNPVVACAQIGKGRYVASGIALGLGPGDAEVAPTGGELKLLTNAIAWLGG